VIAGVMSAKEHRTVVVAELLND